MNCEVSVIVPVYNAEKYLDRCIQSILNQTFNNFELLLINDGSVDNSLNICNKYQNIDKRIRVISQENKGVSFSRNVGIRNSNGNFLLFIDSDDWIEVDMIEYLYNLIINYGADVSICKCKLYIDGKLKNKNNISESITKYETNRDIVEAFIVENKFLFSPCNKLYKKSLFIENEIIFPLNIKYGEDALLNYKIFLNTDKVVFSNLQKYNYYINDSSSIKKFDESRLDILTGIEEIYSMVNSKYPEFTNIIANTYITSSMEIIRSIAKNMNILKNKYILKKIRLLSDRNKYILKSCCNLNYKYKVLYSIMKISPILVVILYKINFIIKGRYE